MLSRDFNRKETSVWNFRTRSSSLWLAWTWHLAWLSEARAAGVCRPTGLHGDGPTDSGETLRTTSMTCMPCAVIMAPCKGGTTQVCSTRGRAPVLTVPPTCCACDRWLCFRTLLSLPAGSVPTTRVAFTFQFSVPWWSGSDPSRESGGLCRGVASSGSPRTCLPDLACKAPFKVLLCFVEGLASPWSGVVVDHFFLTVSLKWLVRGFLFAFCSNLFSCICQSSSAHHEI